MPPPTASPANADSGPVLFTAAWDNCSVHLSLDYMALKERAERFLALDLKPSAGGGRPDISIRRTDSGWAFESSIGARSVMREDDAAFLLFELLAMEFGNRTRRPVVHAGVFMVDGGAVLYLGDRQQGKSSLTFAAWRRGHAILGDDRITLAIEDDAVRSLPKCLKLRLDHSLPRAEWRSLVPQDSAFVGTLKGDSRWILSRRLPGVLDSHVAVPVRAVAVLRRIDAGPTHIDEVATTEALADALPMATVGENTPLDVLRFLKPHAPGGRIRRLNVAPGDIERGVDLLAKL